jgi:hypothetical protein
MNHDAWVESKVKEKHEYRSRFPIIEKDMGNSKIGNCEVHWLARFYSTPGSLNHFERMS